jgi:predicted dienelactone hydrolase
MRCMIGALAAVIACQPHTAVPSSRTEPGAPASSSSSGPAAEAFSHLGVRTLEGRDPVTDGALPMALIYPAGAPASGSAAEPAGEAPTMFGAYPVAAVRDAPIAPGRRPLIVVSHGHGGALWGHHDLAEALARAGYIAALVEHVGDSWRDQSGFRTGRSVYGRAHQVSAVIDRLLEDPEIAAQIDGARIGVAGFSAGGYTSLLVVGAEPDYTRVPDYCARHPEDSEICSDALSLAAIPAHHAPTKDPRVSAAFVMAPFAVVFGPDAFRAVTSPVFLAWADADRVLLPDENAAVIAPALQTLVGKRVIAGAGHYVFLAPCPPAIAAQLPLLCVDPPGIDRAHIHELLATDAVAFFDHTWSLRRR